MKRRVSKQPKVDAEITPEEAAMAREVSAFYLACMKKQNRFAKLVPAGKKIEDTRWWQHFVKTARVIAELEADPRQYVTLQFERLAWKRGAVPYPTQLHNDGAILFYVEKSHRFRAREERKEASKNVMVDPHDRERVKLAGFAKRLGVSSKRVLKECPREFSPGFHRLMGTWSAVRELVDD